MQLIDDEGNLFGIVNAVDAFAVLLVIAVLTAGAAFALQPDPEPQESDRTSRHATLDLGSQPDYIIAELNEGDTYSASEKTNLTITDVHLEPTTDGSDTRVFLRVELVGESTETADNTGTPMLSYEGAPPRLGRNLDIVTDSYQVSGRITDVGDESSLPTVERTVLLETTVDADTATIIEEGDQFTLRERTLGAVEHVEVYGTNKSNRKRVLLGVTLTASEMGDGTEFAGTRLRQGATIPFRTADYDLMGEITRVDATEPRGEPTTRTVTLTLENVSPELSTSIRSGMTESANGNVLAELTDVQREPSTIVLVSDDGNIYEREHPRNEDVTITADLAVRETATGITFKGEPLQYGSTVTLDLGSVTVTMTVGSM
ncbi:DUF4330 family protein [Halorarum salinum]|uniref:DUF4330 family protein n=1 Tax=Halorarum salinum TaxID=2743089 RepID=A0A7D5Q8N8_9EURY|nr:DUF4330 family protein [Halobaculum salinum]QLG61097.1 DUF4330 family protein [Halobaculum salinum]